MLRYMAFLIRFGLAPICFYEILIIVQINIPWSIIQHFFKKLQFFKKFSFLLFNIAYFGLKKINYKDISEFFIFLMKPIKNRVACLPWCSVASCQHQSSAPSRNPLKAGPVDDAQKIFSRKLLVTSVLCLSMNICSEIE